MCTTDRLTHILGSSKPLDRNRFPSQALLSNLAIYQSPSCLKQLQALYVLDSSYTVIELAIGTMSSTVLELGTMNSPPNRPPPTAETIQPKRDDVRLEVSDKPLPGAPAGDVENQPLLGPRPDESMAEMEINSLLWIKKPENEALKEALETWQAKDELFARRVDKKRLQSSSLMNEIYQLIGFYSVFQGVLLTAVSQSSLLFCHNWWTAFFLSLLASLVTTAGVIQKFRSVLALEWTISNEDRSRKDCITRVQTLLRKRETFSLREDAKDNKRPVPKQTRLKVSAVLVVLVLLLFSALFLASILQILCDSGISGPAPSPLPL